MKNLSSMTAIVVGLTHHTITKLKLSWAHVKNSLRLEPLIKLTDSVNNYSAYRMFYKSFDGPCVPYLGQYLSALEHIDKNYPDTIPDAEGRETQMINFVKRTKWAEVIQKMLEYQTKPYANLDEDPVVTAFVQEQLMIAGSVQSEFWEKRSEVLQAAEAEHADIRKNLKAAGF